MQAIIRFRRPTRVIALAALAALAAACSSAAAPGAATAGAPGSAGPVRGGVLQWALAEDPLSMNPWGGGSGNDQLYVTRQLFDTLIEQDPATGRLLPFLAARWTANAAATAFSLTLRSGVTFSDGTPLTARVVKDNFDNIAASGAAATWVAGDFV